MQMCAGVRGLIVTLSNGSLFAWFIAACYHQHQSASNVNDVLSRSVVIVRTPSTWASGVVVDAVRGLILTCRHAVSNSEDREHVTVQRGSLPGPRERALYPVPATVLASTDVSAATSSADLAILKIATPRGLRHLGLLQLPLGSWDG